MAVTQREMKAARMVVKQLSVEMLEFEQLYSHAEEHCHVGALLQMVLCIF
jgi:hypothetical protein